LTGGDDYTVNDDYIVILQDLTVEFENGEVGRFKKGELVRTFLSCKLLRFQADTTFL
jgi:hypothetical protein